jgi:addiction module RelE/StbE family toxin
MVEVNWTDQALDDIHAIAQYISKDSFRYASLQVKAFFKRTEGLLNHPKMGRIVPELKNANIRELISGNYRVIYKIVSKKRIDIITVHHSKRLLSNNPSIESIV